MNGGKSKIIIGSRSDEAWLKTGTFENNHLLLRGLDKEAVTNFADKILFDIGVSKSTISKDTAFEKLLKLLAGYPLALKAVLPNLKNKSSRKILEELEEGMGDLDKGNAQEKTESIVKCIEYSHSNLSEEAQQLLLCLAPFVGVVNLTPNLIKFYFDDLGKNPMFKGFPFDKISIVVEEAIQNGFMQKAISKMSIMELQPVFTYFLKNKIVDKNIKSVLEEAYIIYCSNVGRALRQLMISKNPQEQQIGYLLTGLEFENFYKALFLQLAKQRNISNLILPINFFMKNKQLHQKSLEIMNVVYEKMQLYDKEKLEGEIGVEFIGVLDMIANANYLSNFYSKAKAIWLDCILIHKQNNFLKENPTSGLGVIYQSLGVVSKHEKNYQSAKGYYQEALTVYEQFDDAYAQAKIYQNLGNVASYEGDYQSAKDYYQKALTVYEQFDDVHAQAKIYQNLGNIADDDGYYQSAKNYYQKALTAYEQFDDTHSQAGIYQNLGLVAYNEKDYQSAKNYYQKALTIYEQFDDVHGQARVYQNLGNVAYRENVYQSAKDYYQKALTVYEQFDNVHRQAMIYENLGNVADDEGSYQPAKDYYQKALTGFLKYKDIHAVMQVLGNALNLDKEAKPKAFAQSLLDQVKNVFKDDREKLEALELVQVEIDKLEV